jgi:hypothetical protein
MTFPQRQSTLGRQRDPDWREETVLPDEAAQTNDSHANDRIG